MHSYIHIISHLHMRVIIWMLRIWRFSVFSIFSRTNSKRSRKKAIDINLCKNVEIASTVVSPVAAAVNLQFWFFLHCFVFFFFLTTTQCAIWRRATWATWISKILAINKIARWNIYSYCNLNCTMQFVKCSHAQACVAMLQVCMYVLYVCNVQKKCRWVIWGKSLKMWRETMRNIYTNIHTYMFIEALYCLCNMYDIVTNTHTYVCIFVYMTTFLSFQLELFSLLFFSFYICECI